MKSTRFSQLHSKLYVYIVAASCVALALVLSPIRARAQLKGLPPIIDRELFFGDPEISGAQISPDGRFIAFVKPLKGTRNIWVKRTEEPFSAAKPITADTTRPIPAYFWSRDGKYILFVQDKAGDENYLVCRSQRPRQGLARSLQGQDFYGSAHSGAPEHRAYRELDFRP